MNRAAALGVAALLAVGAGVPVRAAEPAAVSVAAPTDRDSFTQQAAADMRHWGERIYDLAVAGVVSGAHVDSQAEDDLTVAWRRAGAASTALGSVGNDGWLAAKSAYEAAARDLGTAWHRLHPAAV